ncbi:uncharacterized protein LOC123559371 [Mercenaria mercenaria]|uniref:uncharacterized protein LOC123559371 n=1 Tax=Mercenaria mercenaria TaxID=6596 RepID=UPI00234F2261|nr:uncharacterized protein LOC123559371 [Mercenaria mercenaria]
MESKRSYMRNRNPFAVDPLPKAYYHPSPERRLNKAEKSLSIKPSSSSEDTGADNEESRKISPVDEMFLRGTNMYQTRPSKPPGDTEDDVNFDESWPCSERPSSVSLNEFEEDSSDHLNKYLSRIDSLIGLKPNSDSLDEADLLERRRMPGSSARGTGVTASRDTGKPLKSRIPVKDTRQGGRKLKAHDLEPEDEAETDGSVLQRYINRFRNSAPMSREEREEQSKSASQDFWWLSNGAPPAKTREKKKKDGADTQHTTPLTTVNLDKYKELQKLADKQRYPAHIPESPGDKRTIELQERAEKLLERSSSTVLSTDPAVSTEGLGSNTSDMSSLDEYTYRPKFASYLDSDQRTGSHQYSQPPLLGQRPQADADQRVGYQQFVPRPMPGQRPPTGDDPLHQWRLRRRMELAQQSAPQHTPQFDFINKTEQQKKIDQKLEEFKQRLSGRAPARSQVQFTPAPMRQQEQMQSPQRPESGRFHEPQIASPSLHAPKPRSEPVEEIDPHLHLMCDLLPCPHRGQLQGTTDQGTSSNTRSNFKKNVGTRNNSDSNQDEKYDKMGKYKQYLEAEKPDVEKSDHETDITDVDRGKNIKSDERKGQKTIQEIENMVKDIGAEDDKSSNKSDIVEDNLSQKSDRKKEKEQNSEHSGSESERSETKSKHSEKVADSDERLKESEDKREKVMKPKHSSSPKSGRKGVSAAIGQAVKEHLFSTSTSTVLSSVDSLPPSASTDRLPWKHKPPSHDQSHDQQVRQLENYDVPYESDEEFSDDSLLQMLRKQRAMYEQQLQEIDSILNKAKSS